MSGQMIGASGGIQKENGGDPGEMRGGGDGIEAGAGFARALG
jgi:hypothetical protein